MSSNLTIYTLTIGVFLINFSNQEIDLIQNLNDQSTLQFLKLPTLIPIDNISQENPTSFESPKNEDDLFQLMKTAPKYQVQYSQNVNNSINHTTGTLISLENFSEIHCCHGKQVYVGAGVSYKKLIDNLKKTRYGLINVPNNIHDNVVNSIITGAFSANYFSSIIANEVVEIVVLNPNGTKRYYTPRDHEFKSITLGFGFAGIVIGATLKVVTGYEIKKCIYQNLLHYDFTRKLHLMFYRRNYSWFFLDLKTMKWEIHQLFFQKSKEKSDGMCWIPVKLINRL